MNRDAIPPSMFQRPPAKPTFEDCCNPETMAPIVEESRKQANRDCMPQVEALMAAGWIFEMVRDDLEPWQWAWRSTPKRKNSNGRRYASTQQAFNALMKERSNGH